MVKLYRIYDIEQENRREEGGPLSDYVKHSDYAALEAKLQAAQERYNDLIMEVQNKHPGESRHETAKRYIHERENKPAGTAQQALQQHDEGGGEDEE